MLSKQELLTAPGHVFLTYNQTGIEWFPDRAKLWNFGTLLGEASHKTRSKFEFWNTLAFLDCFPNVEKWWFFALWNGQVTVKYPGFSNGGSVWGNLQYQGEFDKFYIIHSGYPPQIDVPLPIASNNPGNLPLRIAISRLVLGIITEEIVAGQPYTVTSLVGRNDLAKILPEDSTRPAGIDFIIPNIPVNLRQFFCNVQGLREEKKFALPVAALQPA